MTRAELIDLLCLNCDGSGLPVSEKVAALRVAQTRIQMNVGAGRQKPKKIEVRPLTRPSGNFMGKQKREPKGG